MAELNVKGFIVNNDTLLCKDEEAREQIGSIADCSDTSFMAALVDILYPVGSIYISLTDSAPFGGVYGTWEKIAAGRTLVGVDTTNSLMSSPGDVFGDADSVLPLHSHNGATEVSAETTITTESSGAHTHTLSKSVYRDSDRQTLASGNQGYPNGTRTTSSAGAHTHSVTLPGHSHTIQSEGIDPTDTNYQPSLAVFIWQRVETE